MNSKLSTSVKNERRGLITLWTILFLPVLLIVLVVVVEIAHLWYARVELENAMEAAALASAKEWALQGGGSNTQIARDAGVAYAEANTVSGRYLNDGQVDFETNYNDANDPNENASCDGNLIFGAVTETGSSFDFDAGTAAGCVPADVFIEIYKTSAGGGAVDPRTFGVFYDNGPANLSIRSVSFTLPTGKQNQLGQWPFFDSSTTPEISTDPVGPDDRNRNNATEPNDVRGITTTPTFSFSDLFDTNKNRTLTITFVDGEFTSTGDLATTDFIRYGASINQVNPPVFPPGTHNDGDAWGIAGVRVSVVFYDTGSGTTMTGNGRFVDDDDENNISIANLGGGGSGRLGVRAQATVEVLPLVNSLFGCPIGPFSVQAKSTAIADCGSSIPTLIRVENYDCP